MNFIEKTIKERLDGDESRLAELFQDEAFYNELVSSGSDNDWLHYTAKNLMGYILLSLGKAFLAMGKNEEGNIM